VKEKKRCSTAHFKVSPNNTDGNYNYAKLRTGDGVSEGKKDGCRVMRLSSFVCSLILNLAKLFRPVL